MKLKGIIERIVWATSHEPEKVYGSKVYSELCIFEYWVKNCPTTAQNYQIVLNRLRQERAKPEMEDIVFNYKVGEITQIFEQRFRA